MKALALSYAALALGLSAYAIAGKDWFIMVSCIPGCVACFYYTRLFVSEQLELVLDQIDAIRNR